MESRRHACLRIQREHARNLLLCLQLCWLSQTPPRHDCNMFRALGDLQQPVLGALERSLASRKPPPKPVVYPQGTHRHHTDPIHRPTQSHRHTPQHRSPTSIASCTTSTPTRPSGLPPRPSSVPSSSAPACAPPSPPTKRRPRWRAGRTAAMAAALGRSSSPGCPSSPACANLQKASRQAGSRDHTASKRALMASSSLTPFLSGAIAI